jgi:hypothetical protein
MNFSLAALVVIVLSTVDLSGVWTITPDSLPGSVTCTFKQEGDKLTGECKGAGGAALKLAGEVSGSEVSWAIDNEMIFAGTIDETGRTIEGAFSFDGGNGSGTFTAQKQ